MSQLIDFNKNLVRDAGLMVNELSIMKQMVNELSLMKQLIKERAHPLDLLRELISNAGSREVGATEIRIKYTVDDFGHIFEVSDNGCGMDFTDNKMMPGRLDKFFGLGLSTIVGIKSDEFSWKGLGSKLAYKSRKIEIDTYTGTGDAIKVEIHEPWNSIERKIIPKPKLFLYKPENDRKIGTSIKVIGHPPHRRERPFSVEEIKNYLLRRTFVGFTRQRENIPRIILSVLGNTEVLDFGFPELKFSTEKKGTIFVDEQETVAKHGMDKFISVKMKGFYTWDEKDCGLFKGKLNTGLILSVRGIPYFNLDMEEYGSRSLRTVRPGINRCCLIVECDQIQEDMNISRSGLVDSEDVDLFKSAVTKIFERIESSDTFLHFRKIQQERRTIAGDEKLRSKKRDIESDAQKWVIYEPPGSNKPIILSREPENRNDVLCILWKLESLNALPFKKFQTLGHVGAGPDLIAHFQENEQSIPDHSAFIKVENKFSCQSIQGNKVAPHLNIICWDIRKTPKVLIQETDKVYKFVALKEDLLIHIFALRMMDNVRAVTKKELSKLNL